MKILLASFLFLSTQLFSQDTSKILKEVEVMGIRALSTLPITKTNISLKEIQKNYSGEDAPILLLTKTPNLTFYSDGGNYNGYMYYRLRGIDQTRINTTLDGVPLNEPEDQGAYFSNYTDFLSNINSIQVQRGVGVSSNGVSSFAGSLNFESINLLDSPSVQASINYGSFNTIRTSVAINQKQGDFYYYGRVSDLKSNGYRDHSGTNAQTGFISAGYYKNNSQLKLISFVGRSRNEMAYLAADEDSINTNRKYNPLSKDEKDDFLQNFNSVAYIYSFNKNLNITASGYYNRLVGNYDVLIDSVFNNFNLKSNFYGLILNTNYTKNKLSLSSGIHINFYEREHYLLLKPKRNLVYDDNGKKNEQSIYFKPSYKIGKLLLFTDFQLRNITFNYHHTFPTSITLPVKQWNFFNFRAGIDYKVKTNLITYVFVGTSKREPTRSDLFAGFDDIDSSNINFIGKDLNKVKPESVVDYEIGVETANKIGGLKIGAYMMQFKDEIQAIGQLSYIGLPLRKNVSKSLRTGLETEGYIKLDHHFKIIFNEAFNYAKIDSYVNDADSQTYKNRTPLLTPAFILNNGIEYNKNQAVFINLSLRYISRSFLDNENTLYLPEFFELNSFIKFDFKKYNLLFQINNIMNNNNYNSGYVTAGKRDFFVATKRNYSISANFNIR